MTEKELINGKVFRFENKENVMEVAYKKNPKGASLYTVWFNGRFVKLTKTLPPVQRKVSELIDTYNLIRWNV